MTEESAIPVWQESITLIVKRTHLIVNHVTKLNSLPTITEEIAEKNAHRKMSARSFMKISCKQLKTARLQQTSEGLP
jgi:hypothetical protein